MKKLKKLPARFYCTSKGNEPVREWLKKLDEGDRRLIGMDIATAEYGWPVGMPLSKPLGNGLFEIRTPLSDGKIARMIVAIVDQHMALLHGFIKKTQKTPKPDLELALKRLKEM